MQLTDMNNNVNEVEVNITGDNMAAAEIGSYYRQYKEKRATKQITGMNIDHKKDVHKLIEFKFSDGSTEQVLIV